MRPTIGCVTHACVSECLSTFLPMPNKKVSGRSSNPSHQIHPSHHITPSLPSPHTTKPSSIEQPSTHPSDDGRCHRAIPTYATASQGIEKRSLHASIHPSIGSRACMRCRCLPIPSASLPSPLCCAPLYMGRNGCGRLVDRWWSRLAPAAAPAPTRTQTYRQAGIRVMRGTIGH